MRKSTLLILLIILAPTFYFVYGMIAWNVFISFTGWKGAIPSYNFVCLENYLKLFQDPLFWRSFWNTLLLFLMIPCSLGLGLFLATLLNQKVRGTRVFLIIYLVPFAFSFVVTAVVWAWMLAPESGAVNTILRSIGLGSLASGWYTDPNTAMLSILIVTVWQFTGYCALILFAGMRSIPQKEIDAAKSKGASTFGVYRTVVLPRLKIYILTSVVVLLIFSLKTFDLIWVMTGGGPGNSSYTLPVFVVKEAFHKLHIASGAAASNILVAMVLCIVVPYLYWSYRGGKRKIVTKKKVPSWQPWRRMRKIMGEISKRVGRPLLSFIKIFQKIGKTLQKKAPPLPFKRIALYLILIFFAVFFLLPIWVAFMTSLKPEVEVITSNPLLPPTSPTSDAYADALGKLGRPMINTLMFVTGAVVCSVLIGSILGYIFSKIKFRYSMLVFLIVAAGTFLPYTTIVFPLFRTISGLNLAYTIPGLILVHTIYGIPVCAILFRSFYAEIPQSIIDKAKKRGAGDWEIYRKIILPASGTAIVVVVMYQFTSIWNDFLFGLILGGAETQAMPVTYALACLFGGTFRWSLLMAGAIIVFLPVVLLYIFLQKYFVRGMKGST